MNLLCVIHLHYWKNVRQAPSGKPIKRECVWCGLTQWRYRRFYTINSCLGCELSKWSVNVPKHERERINGAKR